MRMWYQSFSRFDAFGHYGSALLKQISHAADPETQIEAHGRKKKVTTVFC